MKEKVKLVKERIVFEIKKRDVPGHAKVNIKDAFLSAVFKRIHLYLRMFDCINKICTEKMNPSPTDAGRITLFWSIRDITSSNSLVERLKYSKATVAYKPVSSIPQPISLSCIFFQVMFLPRIFPFKILHVFFSSPHISNVPST